MEPAIHLHQDGQTILCQSTSPLATRLSRGDWPPGDGELQVVKRSPKATSGYLCVPEGDQQRLFFKWYRTSGLGRNLLTRQRLRRTWQINWYLHEQGVPVPRPHAIILGKTGAWLLTEAVAGAQALTECLAQRAVTLDQARRITLDTARDIAHMHTLGVTHGDLKWGNLLVTPSHTLVFVDLDSARQRSHVSANQGAKDLARYTVSGLEQNLDAAWAFRLCQTYGACRSLSAEQIFHATRPIVRRIGLQHQKRYGRPPVTL